MIIENQPPPAVSTHLRRSDTCYLFNPAGTSSHLHQHPHTRSLIQNAEAQEQQVQSLLSLPEAQYLARGRLRAIPCPWHCDAVLASVELLEKHINNHLSHLVDQDDTASERETASLMLDDEPCVHKCRWERCSQNFSDMDNLQRHILVHIRKLANDHCPHRKCQRPNVPIEKMQIHTKVSHPLPWTENDLRKTTRPQIPRTPRPPPPPIPLEWDVPPYYLTVTAFPFSRSIPSTASPSAQPMKRESSRNKSRSATPPSHSWSRISPIVPDRSNLLFTPFGESPIFNSLDSATSSIFPSTRSKFQYDERREREIERENNKTKAILSVSRSKIYVPFSVAPRPSKPRRPLIWNGPIAYATRRRAELDVEVKTKRQKVEDEERTLREWSDQNAESDHCIKVDRTDTDVSGGDSAAVQVKVEVEGPAVDAKLVRPELAKFEISQIRKASHVRATRRVGRTIGMAYLEARIAFEQEGVELGELFVNQLPLD